MTFGACRPDATLLFGSAREVPAVISSFLSRYQTRCKIRDKPGVYKLHSFASDASVCALFSVHHIPVAQAFRPEVVRVNGSLYPAAEQHQVALPIRAIFKEVIECPMKLRRTY